MARHKGNQNKNMNWYYIKCKKHFPGWELDIAESIDDFKKTIKKWTNCQLDYESIEEHPDKELLSSIGEYEKSSANNYLASYG